VVQFLQERGLELSPVKTVITPVEKGFDFLGQNVRKYPKWEIAHQAFRDRFAKMEVDCRGSSLKE
jgi:hypothetical protein